MSPFEHLMSGFAVALSWQSLFYCFIGCLWGTIVGVLPGLGPLAGMVLLLPLTFGLDPANGIIMLTGIFYGAMYGGSTTSILVRIPGEAASVVTCIDGYEMARQGRAGPALMIAAVGSFIGGTVSVLGPDAGRPAAGTRDDGDRPVGRSRADAAGAGRHHLGVGRVAAQDRHHDRARAGRGHGRPRQDHRHAALHLRQPRASPTASRSRRSPSACSASPRSSSTWRRAKPIKAIRPKLRELVPRWADLKESAPAIGRGTIVGFIFGIIPGVSHVVSTFVSYALEKRFSRHPEKFGKGAIAGVAGPETANNATTGTAMIPLLALGIPSIPATAILLSALTIHGVQPGPLLMTDNPQVFWGLVASMYIGNAVLLALNLPFVGLVREPAAHSLRLAGAHHPGDLDDRRLQRQLQSRPTSGSW